MIEAFQYINKAFESKVRLGIMAVLMVNEEADFNFLKEQLSLTDGNLASHTRALEELGYIVCNKSFVGRKPRTVFQATPQGRQAFKSHIEALEKFLTGAATYGMSPPFLQNNQGCHHRIINSSPDDTDVHD